MQDARSSPDLASPAYRAHERPTPLGSIAGATGRRRACCIVGSLLSWPAPSRHDMAFTTRRLSTIMGLAFLPRAPPARPGKRSRAAADIDGEHSCLQKKKRRLRLDLVTSPLSPHFSHPATNILHRGRSRAAAWARQRALGRHLLRKAAILNHMRRRTGAAAASRRSGTLVPSSLEQAMPHEQLQLARLAFDHGALDTPSRRPVRSPVQAVPPTRSPVPPPPMLPAVRPSFFGSPNEAYADSSPRRDYALLPPPPLGLSNYDAFDVDDEGGEDAFGCLDEAVDDEDQDQDEDVPFSPYAAGFTTAPLRGTLDDLPAHVDDMITVRASRPQAAKRVDSFADEESESFFRQGLR